MQSPVGVLRIALRASYEVLGDFNLVHRSYRMYDSFSVRMCSSCIPVVLIGVSVGEY